MSTDGRTLRSVVESYANAHDFETGKMLGRARLPFSNVAHFHPSSEIAGTFDQTIALDGSVLLEHRGACVLAWSPRGDAALLVRSDGRATASLELWVTSSGA